MRLEDGAYSALHTDAPYALDITAYRQKGKELKDTIEGEVKGTQSLIVRSLPSKLIMTQRQYNDLVGQPELMDTIGEGQSYWFYRTNLNVMEVEIKEGTASEIVTLTEDEV